MYLKKRGRYYYVRYKLNGKTIDKSLSTRHKDVAQKMIRELERKESLGEINPLAHDFNPAEVFKEPERAPKCKTVEEAIEMFYHSRRHRSPKTLEAYKWALDHFAVENNVLAADPRTITRDHFENIIFKADIESETRHFYFRHYRAFWNVLLEKEIVTADFFSRIKKNLPDKTVSTRPKMITEKELKKFRKTYGEDLLRKAKLADFDAQKVQHWLIPIIYLYFHGGLRRSEAGYDPDLKYSGIKGKNLIFEDEKLEYIYLEPTKGRKERLIPITKKLKTCLVNYLKIRGLVEPDEYVFIYLGGRTKGRPVRGVQVYKEFKRYAKMAGIPSSRNLHGMRHQAITSWIESGFSTPEAGYMAGHSNNRVTEKYTHLTGKNLRKKMKQLESKE